MSPEGCVGGLPLSSLCPLTALWHFHRAVIDSVNTPPRKYQRHLTLRAQRRVSVERCLKAVYCKYLCVVARPLTFRCRLLITDQTHNTEQCFSALWDTVDVSRHYTSHAVCTGFEIGN